MLLKSKISDKACQLILNGNQSQALQLMIEAYQNSIVNYLQSISWDADEAIDIFNDALLLILGKIERQEISSFTKSYVIKVCKNIGANSWRSKKRKDQNFSKYIDEEVRNIKQSYSDYYNMDLFENETDNKSLLALRAFDILTEKCKKLISFKHVEHFNHAEIVEKCNFLSSEKSSKTVLNRCMNSWKEIYKKLKSNNIS